MRRIRKRDDRPAPIKRGTPEGHDTDTDDAFYSRDELHEDAFFSRDELHKKGIDELLAIAAEYDMWISEPAKNDKQKLIEEMLFE